MEEIWRDVKGYEGLYQVSNLGRVKSLPVSGKGIGKGYSKIERILIPDKSGRYARIHLVSNKRESIHILVAKAFTEICGKWFDGCVVHHKDLDSFNNNAENLICLTELEHQLIHLNEHHRIEKSLKTKFLKGTCNAPKQVIQLNVDGNVINVFNSLAEASRQFMKGSAGHICSAIKDKKIAYGYKWEYANPQ